MYSQWKIEACIWQLLNIILIVTKLIFDVAATSAVFFKKKNSFPQNINPVIAKEKLRLGPYQAYLLLKSPICNKHFILHINSIGDV